MYTSYVFVTHFQQLRRKREIAENRDISLMEIAETTKISYSTLQRFATKPESVNVSTVGELCAYFNVKSVADLIEWKPDTATATEGDQGK